MTQASRHRRRRRAPGARVPRRHPPQVRGRRSRWRSGERRRVRGDDRAAFAGPGAARSADAGGRRTRRRASRSTDKLPLIAFVTAYDEYAVRAFEMNAVDYLLKPVDPTRLARHGQSRDGAARARRVAPGRRRTAFAPRRRSTRRRCRRHCCDGFRCESATTSFSCRWIRSCRSSPTESCCTSSRGRAIATRSPIVSRTSRRGSTRRSSFESRAARCSTSA